MQCILKDYSSSASICDCIIHILVRVAQIGPQSRVSILRSGILSNMDTVLIIHMARCSLVCNIMQLFTDLAEVPSGVTFLLDSNCFSASLRAIDLCVKEGSKEKFDVVCKALQFVQSIMTKNECAFACFEKNGGFELLLECWKQSEHSVQVRKELLICLSEILQYEEGNAKLEELRVLPTLLEEEKGHSVVYYISEFWNSVNMFIQFHSEVVSKEDCDLILLLATRALGQDTQAKFVIRPLFSLVSSGPSCLLLS